MTRLISSDSGGNYRPGDIIDNLPDWVPPEVAEMLKERRHYVLNQGTALTPAEAERYGAAETERRLGALERLGTHERMEALWKKLSEQARDAGAQGTPHNGDPAYFVQERHYRHALNIPEDEPVPDAWGRLKWGRQNIVFIAANAAFFGQPENTEKGRKRRIGEAEQRLKNWQEIVDFILRDQIISEEFQNSISAVWSILKAEHTKANRPFYKRVSAFKDKGFAGIKPHVIKLSATVTSMFGVPQHAIVADALSAAFDVGLDRKTVGQMVSEDEQRRTTL